MFCEWLTLGLKQLYLLMDTWLYEVDTGLGKRAAQKKFKSQHRAVLIQDIVTKHLGHEQPTLSSDNMSIVHRYTG